ncbi:ABC-type transport auxiliary lipoprotein family protein [Rhizobium sp. BK376]|jgi:cholesterol transport system auxiliary component|uniref:ABC-type transport auxiliary lipoprotein family protein n=1 Tax=Rhizobium sp. BK376 TaxID=2512149 RepID=UPI0010469290|nr:ABC-type transport auxiliary lipoprotein family protein [Rhizobium sp. BK376]TCR83984.1 cholesterol transport system auxiliary component [Rhizobium sp. BK376]
MIGYGSVQRWSAAKKAAIALPVIALLIAGCGTAAKNDTFDLSVTPDGSGPAAKGKQILIPQPTALSALDSNQILVRVSSSEIQYLSRSQWGDKLPRMVQSKLVEAFENSRKLGGVGVPGQGLAIDYQVVTDIRSFEIDNAGHTAATVEISAKILNDRTGTIKAQNVFRKAVPVSGGTNSDFVKALNVAFEGVATDIVDWTLHSI